MIEAPKWVELNGGIMYATVLYVIDTIHKHYESMELAFTKTKELRVLAAQTSPFPWMIWFQTREFIDDPNNLT